MTATIVARPSGPARTRILTPQEWASFSLASPTNGLPELNALTGPRRFDLTTTLMLVFVNVPLDAARSLTATRWVVA